MAVKQGRRKVTVLERLSLAVSMAMKAWSDYPEIVDQRQALDALTKSVRPYVDVPSGASQVFTPAAVMYYAQAIIDGQGMRRASMVEYERMKKEQDTIALWLRDNCKQQIAAGRHDGLSLSQVVIAYMSGNVPDGKPTGEGARAMSKPDFGALGGQV